MPETTPVDECQVETVKLVRLQCGVGGRGANSRDGDFVRSRCRSSSLRNADSSELAMYIPLVGAAGLEPATRGLRGS